MQTNKQTERSKTASLSVTTFARLGIQPKDILSDVSTDRLITSQGAKDAVGLSTVPNVGKH